MSKKIYKKPLHGLAKILRKHDDFCSVHIYSGDRHCSCGLEEAIEELKIILLAEQNNKNYFKIRNKLLEFVNEQR
jgi:hypothetical protein